MLVDSWDFVGCKRTHILDNPALGANQKLSALHESWFAILAALQQLEVGDAVLQGYSTGGRVS